MRARAAALEAVAVVADAYLDELGTLEGEGLGDRVREGGGEG